MIYMKTRNKKPGLIMNLLLLTLSASGLYGVGLSVVSDNPGKKPYRVPKVDTGIKVDGILDEEVWQQALKLELKYEVNPGENISAPVRTEVFLAHSNTAFFIGFRAHDPEPSTIRATFSDRDKISTDDYVNIRLDTFNDQRRAYTFYSNPLGVQMDAVKVMSESNYSWDTIWNSAGRIAPPGYIVEMSIPFRSLRFQQKKGDQVWGFNLERNYPRNLERLISFIPHDRNNACLICQLDKLIGFAGARGGKNIELDPSVSTVFTQERENVTQGDWIKKESKLDPGITFQWGITPNMMLSAAVNPDFSHVEADAAQLDVNTQFALYYPEKRPFFLEGASVFSTPLNVIYSRSLADPDWGIKLTGKQGPHALGFYSLRDNITNLVFPGSQTSTSASIDMKSMGTVLRYRFDLGQRASTLGLLVTDREGEDYFNRLAGLDMYWRFTPRKSVTIQFLGSRTRYPLETARENGQPQDAFTGTALDFAFKHESRNIGCQFNYQQVSPEFRADLGYMPQVGYRRYTAVLIATSWRNPGHWYTFLDINPILEYEVDYNNRLIHKKISLLSHYYGPVQSYCLLRGELGKQSFMGEVFDISVAAAYARVRPSGSLTLAFFIGIGDSIDFSNCRQGRQFTLNSIVTYKAGRHFSMSLNHVFQRFKVDAGRLYTANVSNLTAIYQFSRRAFLRTILQYVHYDYNAGNYTFPINPKFKHLFTQVLFSYKVNPQTVLFLGYSDDHYGYLQTPLTQTNRTFFLKIGYALVL